MTICGNFYESDALRTEVQSFPLSVSGIITITLFLFLFCHGGGGREPIGLTLQKLARTIRLSLGEDGEPLFSVGKSISWFFSIFCLHDAMIVAGNHRDGLLEAGIRIRRPGEDS